MTPKKPTLPPPAALQPPKPPFVKPAAPSPVPTATPSTWAKSALMSKAQRYAEEMNQHPRADWRFGLWSTFTLEVLARAALAHVSPTLLAETGKESWHNLYHALGHSPKAPKFVPKSIDVSSVFLRLGEIAPKFDSRLSGFSIQHLARRNEDLHSGGTPLDGLKPEVWQPLFYESCQVLLEFMGHSLKDLIGKPDAAAATKMIAAAKDESAKAVEKSVQAHRTVWEAKPAKDQAGLSAQATGWATKAKGHGVQCPACKCDALVNGQPIAAPVIKLKDGLILEIQEFLPAKFQCIACGLKISGLPQLHACNLASPYTAKTSYDPAEYYAEQAYLEYEPDNND